MSLLSGNMDTVQLLGYPIAGALGGLGLAGMNKYYSQALYGNSSNDPFIGNSWDFVLTGASIGGGVAAVSAGIKYQAQQLKLQRYQGLSETSMKMLAMGGKL